MKNLFRFKAFQVDQTGCAMRINTDGVLLGAVAITNKPARVLDIGTGTGVIAMMLAQRFPDATVDAVEIDESAAAAAAKNALNSPFADRMEVVHTSIEDYSTDHRYDLIVSNPPYFVNDLKNPEHRKGIARHADSIFFEHMLQQVALLLNKTGSFWFILPVKQAQNTIEIAAGYGLSPSRIIHLHSDEHKPEFRQIVCLDYTETAVIRDKLYIYSAVGVYTDAYKNILKNFFLAF